MNLYLCRRCTFSIQRIHKLNWNTFLISKPTIFLHLGTNHRITFFSKKKIFPQLSCGNSFRTNQAAQCHPFPFFFAAKVSPSWIFNGPCQTHLPPSPLSSGCKGKNGIQHKGRHKKKTFFCRRFPVNSS